jgi:hypothetical protein
MLGRFLAAPTGVLLVTACTVPLDAPAVAIDQVTSANRLGYNRLGYNRLGYNRLGYNKLSSHALSQGALVSEGWDEVLADDDARVLFQYVYECAAPADRSLTIAVGGADVTFAGSIGLAPEWLTGACGTECEQWISGCVIARINGLGVTVPLSLRGEHPALDTTAEERETFRFHELAAFGNIFDYDPATGYPRVLGVCQLPGVTGQLASYGVEPSHWLERRICGEAGRCGPLQVHGECKNPMAYGATQGMPQQIACEYKEAGLVDRCHPEVATVPGRDSLENGDLAGYFTTPSYRAINVVLQDRVCGDTWCDPGESFCSARYSPGCAADCPSSCDAFASCGDGVCDGPMTRKRYTANGQMISQMPHAYIEEHYTAFEAYEESAATCPQDCAP